MAIRVSKTKQRSSAPQVRASAVDPQILTSLTWPLDHLLQLQAELLKAAGPSFNGWLERRREGTTAVWQACEKLAACRDLNEALAIQSDWLDGAMKRLDHDIQALADHTLAISHCTAGATRQAAQATTEMATRGAEWVVRAAEPEAEPQEASAAIASSAPLVRSAAVEPSATKAAA